MKEFEIWKEGYAATGEHEEAIYLGKVKGESFKDACKNYFENDPEFPKEHYEEERNMWWNCSLFDNEKDARKTFG